MRQRNVKNLEERIASNGAFKIDDPRALKGKWAEEFGNDKPIFLEIGCGKGQFITKMSNRYPDRNFIAVEGQENVALRTLEKSVEFTDGNLRVFIDYVDDLHDYFEPGELKGIYLNFSDPWPKSRHDKRRLTYHKRLENYEEIVTDGFLEFKTDNEGLFEFTLEEIALMGYKTLEFTRDLANSDYESRLIPTEYEERFKAKGKNINYVKIDLKRGNKMAGLIFAEQGIRTIPKEDRLFGISNRAKAKIAELGRENVVDGTLGVLADDNGKLIVLSSVQDTYLSLQPSEYAAYAPISGIPAYREAVKKAAFGNYEPKAFTESVATMGGTGGIHNAVSNYTSVGDKVLVPDWHWAPYKTIANEMGRDIKTFELFNKEGNFNVESFNEACDELLEKQDRLMTILNFPAHNPTGYALSDDEWQAVVDKFKSCPKEKKLVIFVDAAYVDFAGETDETRTYLPLLDNLPENIMVIIGYSLSKTFTIYGMRCGAMVCMTSSKEIAEEFKLVNEYSSRAAWSNGVRGGQELMIKVYNDEELKAKVDSERKVIRDMLLRRGKAFEKAANECGLVITPFRGGFFSSIPSDNPDALSKELEKDNIYLVPLGKGVRVSLAALSEEVLKTLPQKIVIAQKRLEGNA